MLQQKSVLWKQNIQQICIYGTAKSQYTKLHCYIEELSHRAPFRLSVWPQIFIHPQPCL